MRIARLETLDELTKRLKRCKDAVYEKEGAIL
jgi:hypothetical protein